MDSKHFATNEEVEGSSPFGCTIKNTKYIKNKC